MRPPLLRPSPRSPTLLTAALLLAAGVAVAHDYWLLPDPLRLRAPGPVALSLWVGDDFVPDEQRPWQRARATRFAHLTPRLTEDLLAIPAEGVRPVLRVTLDRPGGHLFVLDRNHARVELPPERFERYLRAEGLDAIVAERASRGESARPGRERYTRYLKAFVQVGPRADGLSMRVVGQALELVPGVDLASLRTGAPLPFAVRFRGAAVAGVTVEALSRVGDDVQRARAVSDAAGRVRFTVTRDATWLVRAVRMERCDGCADAEWESYWAAYTFGVCAPGGAPCAAAPMTVAAGDAGAAQ